MFMDTKTLSIVAYITLIGWIISLAVHKSNNDKNPLVRYHLEQALGIFIFSVVLYIGIAIITVITPFLGFALSFLQLLPLALLIHGIIHAAAGDRKPVWLIGRLCVGRFHFLD